jgi:UDP-N-acetylmuramate--alanine ligase
VVTNLDREHMDCYRDMADVEDAFVEFMDRVPFYGSCVACIDNEQLAGILPRVRRRVFTYGTSSKADFVTRILQPTGDARARFEIAADGQVFGPFVLHVPGRHNVLNASAAVAIAIQLEIKPEAIAQGLQMFRGVDRRFQIKGCERGVAVVDDYGHHPTEIRATLRAARECNYRQVHVIFQPHRYTRTRDLKQEFLTAFEDANTVEMLDIYSASEDPIPGVSAKALVDAIHQNGVEYAASPEEAIDRVVARASDGDVIVTLGAGNVSHLAPIVLKGLSNRQ